jgi:putative transposase
MKYLLREVSRKINFRTDRTNHLFGGPYKWSMINNLLGYQHALKYVFRNPVKAGICSRVEDYLYSSLCENRVTFPIFPSVFDKEGPYAVERSLSWFNLAYSEEEDDCVRRALRRKEFKFSPARARRQIPSILRAL